MCAAAVQPHVKVVQAVTTLRRNAKKYVYPATRHAAAKGVRIYSCYSF
jgi:hypothetical protein